MFLQKTKILEKETEKLLNRILKMGMSLKEAMDAYFSGDFEHFTEYVRECSSLETEVDHIRKDIEMSLYSDMLIPESRGDILKLLEALDDVADCIERLLLEYDIERPVFPHEIVPDMRKLSELCCSCIEKLVQAVTAFFMTRSETNSYIQQVKFFESEADDYEEDIKRKIFSRDIAGELALKLQMKMFTEQLADVTDFAEVVCERLTISAIKRSI